MSHYPDFPTRHRHRKDTVAILKTRFSAAHRRKGDGGVRLAIFSWNWPDFMRNVHGCAFLLDFTLENQGIAETQWRKFLFDSLLQNPKVYFPPIRIVCPYDVELVTKIKNSWIKVIYWSIAKWWSEENVTFLLVYEFYELLLRFDEENRRNRQRCDHRSLFPSPSRVTSRLLRRLEGVGGLADCWKPLWLCALS